MAEAKHRSELLDGLTQVDQAGCPGTVLVFGEGAFAVLTAGDAKDSRAIVAAAEYGPHRGRVVAVAHEGYFCGSLLDKGQGEDVLARMRRLFANALKWAAKGKAAPLTVGITGQSTKWLQERLDASGVAAVAVAWPENICDVLLWVGKVGSGDIAQKRDDPFCVQLRKHVEDGLGLLTCMCPWGFEQITGKNVHKDSAQNHVLQPMGLAYSDEYAPGGPYEVSKNKPDECHAGVALRQAFAAMDAGQPWPASLRSTYIAKCIASVPLSDMPFADRLRSLCSKYANQIDSAHSKADGFKSLAVTLMTIDWKNDVSHACHFPIHADFPGPVKEGAAVLSHQPVALSLAIPGWQSTGLYLPPGGTLTVQLPEGSKDSLRGWTAQIGCHTDKLWSLSDWPRWPEITIAVDLEKRQSVFSPFGGLVYFDAGKGAVEHLVYCSGVVAAPYFTKEVTPEQWLERRLSPAPWGELAGEHVILSLPSNVLATLDEPWKVVDFWDHVMRSHCTLAGTPVPQRPERMVVDRAISAGYMHSGYPVMMHMDQVDPQHGGDSPGLLPVAKLMQMGNWGVFHELGHNRQQPEWTFDGTGEVTVNLFSLYSMESICKIEPWRHPWLTGAKREAAQYMQSPSFAKWKSSPGLALVTYAQLVFHFGWLPIQRVLSDYVSCDKGAKPTADADKIDQWIIRVSVATHKDLRAYFEKWAWPMGAAVKSNATLDALEKWLPDFAKDLAV
eukprot:m.119970 g.119970  ORF g.119970 m.119970 type:complete len:727 (-) comp16168_c0_seq1:64-2244(-)